MIVVIFELEAAEGKRDDYLQFAAELKPLLSQMDGFISIERFQSLSHPEKLLSISFWRDEASVAQWRNIEQHRLAQAEGRRHIFAGYRLRVASVLRDYSLDERREEAPMDSQEVSSLAI